MQKLYDLNDDLVGYITIDGKAPDGKELDLTGPIVQHTDNDYYLSHDFYKNSNRFGARFADVANKFSPDGTLSQNTIIYGHFTDSGKIFAGLYNFEDLDFYKEHSTIEFETLYEKTYWKVYAVFITNTHKEHDDGYIFPYRTLEFRSQENFLQFAEQLRRRSMINTGVDIVEGDKLLTLSTCSRKFKDARFVVVARKVREGEDPNVDLTEVSKNPMPLYPEIWYKEVDKNAVKPIFDEVTITTTEATTMPMTLPSTEMATATTIMPPYSVPQPQTTISPQY